MTYQGIESLTLESGAYDDTLIYQNNQINRYAGNGGTDTFYADVSDWTVGLHWVNDGSEQTFSNGVEGFSVSGVERLLVQTGSGDDVIEQKIAQTNDEIRTGAGDDQIIFGNESGYDAVDGGLGNDNLTLNWNTAGTTYLTVQRADSSWVNVGSGLDEIKANLADAIAFNYSSNGYGYYDELGNYQNHAGSGVTYQGIESLTLESGAYDDTLIYQNNQINRYAGNGGTDTFYADVSDWTVGLHWVNDGSEQTFSNGVEGFTISGVERLLVQTGSGDDVIEQKIAQTNDEIRTGAGE
ncbi:MAG: hypothetical protein IPL02_01335 [Moraxellaceae bacterium]|nr:hypothetical protein [Moraxellaceae bacterium]